MPAMLAFLELSLASHLSRLCKVPPCSLNNPFLLSCFIPVPCAHPPSVLSCLPAVPSQGCVPSSILDIGPFSMVKNSLGPKVSHTLSTLMSSLNPPGLGGSSEWHGGQGMWAGCGERPCSSLPAQ